MKTLFILSMASGYGGAERSIETILQHLPPDVSVHVYAQNPLHIERLSRPDCLPKWARLVRVANTQTVSGRRLAALRLIWDLLRHQPQAVLVNTHSSALVAAMASKLIHDLDSRCTLYVRDFLWRDLDFIFERLARARVVTPSEVVAQRVGYLSPHYLLPLGLCAHGVLPDMVNLPRGEVMHDGPLLHLATINPWKGHADLMLALATLRDRGHPVSACSIGMVGDQALYKRLQRLQQRLELVDRYTLHPFVPDPDSWLRSCSAVVVPSVSHSGGAETFGRAIIEAWAFSKPVIAYATGASAELIEDGVDGLLVPEGDIEGLATAIHRIEADPFWAQALGRAGHAKVLARYEAGAVTRQIVAQLLTQQGERT